MNGVQSQADSNSCPLARSRFYVPERHNIMATRFMGSIALGILMAIVTVFGGAEVAERIGIFFNIPADAVLIALALAAGAATAGVVYMSNALGGAPRGENDEIAETR